MLCKVKTQNSKAFIRISLFLEKVPNWNFNTIFHCFVLFQNSVTTFSLEQVFPLIFFISDKCKTFIILLRIVSVHLYGQNLIFCKFYFCLLVYLCFSFKLITLHSTGKLWRRKTELYSGPKEGKKDCFCRDCGFFSCRHINLKLNSFYFQTLPENLYINTHSSPPPNKKPPQRNNEWSKKIF